MQHRVMQSVLGLGSILGLAFALGCSSSSTSESSSTGAPVSKAEMMMTGAMVSSAMSKATSWHMTMKSGATEMSMDISCPDKMHMQTKSGAQMIETVRVGNDMYTKIGPRWMKVPSSAQQAPVCGGGMSGMNPGAGGRAPTVDPNVTMTKRGSETVNGESCTAYEATSKDDKGATHTFSICVGSDSLPRQVKTGEAVITYSDWNKPVTIEAPQM